MLRPIIEALGFMKAEHPNLERLLDIFDAGAENDWHDLVYQFGDIHQALLLFPIFFPNLIEVEGHVVLEQYIDAEGGKSRLKELLANGERGTREVLSGYRWLEVAAQFSLLGSVNDDDIEALANLMAKSWLTHLRSCYPGGNWSTRILSPSETGMYIGVAFDET